MRWLLALAVALAGWSTPTFAEDTPQVRAPETTFLEAGIFCIRRDGTKQVAPGTESGEINLLPAMPDLVSRTLVVPAALDVSFGAIWAHDRPGLTEVEIRVTRPRPDGTGQRVDSWSSFTEAGAETASLWTLEYPSELATGTWTFEAWAEDLMLWRVTFEVVPLAELPGADQLCYAAIT